MNVIAIANQKGGVGKTTSCLNLGSALKKKGYKVLLIDFDLSANLSNALGFAYDSLPCIEDFIINKATRKPYPALEQAIRTSAVYGLDYIPITVTMDVANSILLHQPCNRGLFLRDTIAYIAANRDYDYILIDNSPSLSVALENALCACTDLLIPAQCNANNETAPQDMLIYLDKIKGNLLPSFNVVGIVPTIYQRTNVSGEAYRFLREKWGELTMQTVIPTNAQIALALVEHRNLAAQTRKVYREAFAPYEALADEVLAHIGKGWAE